MAEGVRIQHVVLKGPAVVLVRDMRPDFKPHTDTPGCAVCSLPEPGHEGRKVKHVKIDSDGYAIVSPAYWEDMKKFIDNGGFNLVNPVPEPPRQELIIGATKTELKTHHKMQRPIITRSA